MLFLSFVLQAIINILKRYYNKHNYSAILQVLPILKAFIAIQPDFYVTLQVSSLLGLFCRYTCYRSFRKDVFERRMLNGSVLLSFLGSGFTHIFQVNRLYESKDISMNTMSLSVDVRRSKCL